MDKRRTTPAPATARPVPDICLDVTITQPATFKEENMKTFDLEECADYLKVNSTTVQGLAAQGKIPGAKIGRAWVFMAEDVADYLREQIRIQTRQRVLREGNDPEPSTAPLPPVIEQVKAVRGRKRNPPIDMSKYGI